MGSELASQRRLSEASEIISTKNMDEEEFSQERLNPSTQGENTAVPNIDVMQERAKLEGLLDASSQETVKVHEELKASLKRWAHEILEQKSLFAIQENEVTSLQQENQRFRELITILRSQVGQVVELQETACQSKTVIEKLRQEVNSLRSFRDEIMDSVLGVTVGQLYRDRCRLQEDVCKCQTQLESAKQDLNAKNIDLELIRDNFLKLEKANRKLEQKVEMMDEQLCKESAGHVDSVDVDSKANLDSLDVPSNDVHYLHAPSDDVHYSGWYFWHRYFLNQHSVDEEALQTPLLLESKAKEMSDSIAELSGILSLYRNPGGLNPYRVAVVESDLWKRTSNASEENWTDFLKHFICLRQFDNFQSETFGRNHGEMLFLDQAERVRKCFEYFSCCKKKGALQMAICHARNLDTFDLLFVEYLTSRSSLLLPLELRALCEVLKNPDQLTAAQLHELLPGIAFHNQNLVDSLILAVEKVWQFHKLCLSFEPPATLFRVAPGSSFNQDYMESINSFEDDSSNSVYKVGFAIYPGFRLQKLIIKCKVFLVS